MVTCICTLWIHDTKQTNKRKQVSQSSHWSITVRELVIERLKACSEDGIVIIDAYDDEYVIAELDLLSDEDLLILFEDQIGFNG